MDFIVDLHFKNIAYMWRAKKKTPPILKKSVLILMDPPLYEVLVYVEIIINFK